MNCRDYQDELYEWFGQPELPEHLRDHLSRCEECRAIHAELVSAGARLGHNELFFMDRAEGDQFVAELNNRLDRLQKAKSSRWGVLVERLVPLAAAAVILLAIGIPAHHWQKSDTAATIDSTAVIDRIAVLNGYDNSYPALDDQTVNALIEDYSNAPGVDASPTLLDNLSEDEWNYLNKNFDVGELL